MQERALGIRASRRWWNVRWESGRLPRTWPAKGAAGGLIASVPFRWYEEQAFPSIVDAVYEYGMRTIAA